MAWADPLLIDNLENPSSVTPLLRQTSKRIDGEPGYREILLQRLIHTTPECLPVREIDTAFTGLRSVCMELPLREGSVGRYADNLLINSDGRICLVECKLASNREADRDVLAQLLDYAVILGGLDYDELRKRVCQATGLDGDPIVDAVIGSGADPDGVQDLIAGIERSLRHGEILLLIVGDRIGRNTERLVQMLQDRVNLGFTFGLVEMPVYSAGHGAGFLVQARVMLRTEVIRRTMFLTGGAAVGLKVPRVEQKQPAANLGEEDFYGSLAEVDPSFPDGVRALLGRLSDLGCEVELLRKYNIYLDDGLGGRLNVLSIGSGGTAYAWAAAGRDSQLGEPVGRQYLTRVAGILPGGEMHDGESPWARNVRVNGKPTLDLRLLLAHQDAWLAAISALRDRLLELQQQRDN